MTLNTSSLELELECAVGKYMLVRVGVGGWAPVGVIIRLAYTKSAVRE